MEVEHLPFFIYKTVTLVLVLVLKDQNAVLVLDDAVLSDVNKDLTSKDKARHSKFCVHQDLREIPTGSPPAGALNTGGV